MSYKTEGMKYLIEVESGQSNVGMIRIFLPEMFATIEEDDFGNFCPAISIGKLNAAGWDGLLRLERDCHNIQICMENTLGGYIILKKRYKWRRNTRVKSELPVTYESNGWIKSIILWIKDVRNGGLYEL